VVDIEAVYDLPVDIYSPCALGATLNSDTLERLKCDIIAGAANNQLDDEDADGKTLMQRGILYAPDFLINAGGLINVGIDYLGGWSKERVRRKVEKIYDTTLEIFSRSEEEDIPTQEAALDIANKRIRDIARLKSTL